MLSRVQFFQGFNLFKGSIGSFGSMVQWFNLSTGSMSARAKLVQKVQAFNWFKGSIVSRAQLDQRFIGLRVQLSQFAQLV